MTPSRDSTDPTPEGERWTISTRTVEVGRDLSGMAVFQDQLHAVGPKPSNPTEVVPLTRAQELEREIERLREEVEALQIGDEVVDRLVEFLQYEWAGPYYARVRDFLPEDMPLGSKRDAAIRAMQEADRDAAQTARGMALKALLHAFEIRPGFLPDTAQATEKS